MKEQQVPRTSGCTNIDTLWRKIGWTLVNHEPGCSVWALMFPLKTEVWAWHLLGTAPLLQNTPGHPSPELSCQQGWWQGSCFPRDSAGDTTSLWGENVAKWQGDTTAAWWEVRAQIPVYTGGSQSSPGPSSSPSPRPDAREQPVSTWSQVYNVCVSVHGHMRSAPHLHWSMPDSKLKFSCPLSFWGIHHYHILASLTQLVTLVFPGSCLALWILQLEMLQVDSPAQEGNSITPWCILSTCLCTSFLSSSTASFSLLSLLLWCICLDFTEKRQFPEITIRKSHKSGSRTHKDWWRV